MGQSIASEKYITLDGLRGAAAILVVMTHFPLPFHVKSIANGYLAVDLFFVMSGFVIASAYEHKLVNGTLDARQFMFLRLIRLYPLYLAGTLLGVAGLLFRLPMSDWHLIGSALLLGVLMLPSNVAIRLFYPLEVAPSLLFPLNFPAWSLFFELLGNAAYAMFFKQLTTRMLLGVIALSGSVLAFKVLSDSTLDFGVFWPGAYVGFARIGYSFFMGVLLFRFRSRRMERRKSDLAAVGLVVIAMVMLCLPVPVFIHPAFVLLVVLFAFPLLVWVAAAADPSHFLRPVFAFSGMVSYGVYVFHAPIENLIQGSLLRMDFVQHKSTYEGMLLLPAVVALAWLAEKRYDLPVRRRVIQAWRKSRYGRSPGIAYADPPANR